MNKKILTLLLGATLLCGCRTRYQITTTNGSEYTAIGKPKRVAGQYYAPRLFSAGTRRLVGALLRLP